MLGIREPFLRVSENVIRNEPRKMQGREKFRKAHRLKWRGPMFKRQEGSVGNHRFLRTRQTYSRDSWRVGFRKMTEGNWNLDGSQLIKRMLCETDKWREHIAERSGWWGHKRCDERIIPASVEEEGFDYESLGRPFFKSIKKWAAHGCTYSALCMLRRKFRFCKVAETRFTLQE